MQNFKEIFSHPVLEVLKDFSDLTTKVAMTLHQTGKFGEANIDEVIDEVISTTARHGISTFEATLKKDPITLLERLQNDLEDYFEAIEDNNDLDDEDDFTSKKSVPKTKKKSRLWEKHFITMMEDLDEEGLLNTIPEEFLPIYEGMTE